MFSKMQNNYWLMVGYVTQPPQARQTQTGKTYTTWSMSIHNEKKQDGTWDTKYMSCKAWREIADAANASIQKGSTVLAIGKLEEYTGNDGKTYKNLNVEFFAPMPSGSAPQPPAAQPTPSAAPGDLSEYEVLVDDADVPF